MKAILAAALIGGFSFAAAAGVGAIPAEGGLVADSLYQDGEASLSLETTGLIGFALCARHSP